MKKTKLGFLTMCAASMLMFSCSEEETANNLQTPESAEVTFAFNISDITKALIEEKEAGECKDVNQLLELAREGSLYANLTIEGVEPFSIRILGLGTASGDTVASTL